VGDADTGVVAASLALGDGDGETDAESDAAVGEAPIWLLADGEPVGAAEGGMFELIALAEGEAESVLGAVAAFEEGETETAFGVPLGAGIGCADGEALLPALVDARVQDFCSWTSGVPSGPVNGVIVMVHVWSIGPADL
jgi:hypothetical protein